MSEQSGNRIPTVPKATPWEGNTIEQNPSYKGSGVQEPVIEGNAARGGAPEWVSHPAKQGQYKNDGGNE